LYADTTDTNSREFNLKLYNLLINNNTYSIKHEKISSIGSSGCEIDYCELLTNSITLNNAILARTLKMLVKFRN
jgi:hypothetical protein